jgi:hypothetical protein
MLPVTVAMSAFHLGVGGSGSERFPGFVWRELLFLKMCPVKREG